ncbi:molybdenum cofactor cytidylyltransferase [Arthrobacter sp. ZBG10]|uniref:nicotine blue oxidoreductase n=1 Tax=Arthrobacter sp. ZBG10 TaxID=1676590 RepID=UPI000681220D|nr:nucleotidyltransferase family protein [Arthrobacter sp. ZBG10]KNH18067.1 molybdenum cofactor cytidylyltransferase [Arthrobacter sp. ZBG10]
MKYNGEPRTTGVVLAAGSGSRLGLGPKALLPYRGRPLVEAAAAALAGGGCSDVVVVLGAGADKVAAAADLAACRVVVNAAWETGMGGSYLLGEHTAGPAGHLLIALVDQPGLLPDTVRRLLEQHRPGRITAAAYREPAAPGGLRRGHPLLIDASLRTAVAATITGDAGARGFLRAHPELVDEVDCSDLSDGQDVDTPDQLHLLAGPEAAGYQRG